MPGKDDLEILKAVLVVATADGKILRSERGVFQNLARRLGLDDASLRQLIDEANYNPKARDELFKEKMGDPAKAMRLLVATARIDGDISQQERELLVDISGKLGIGIGEFSAVYQAGIASADAIRKRNKT